MEKELETYITGAEHTLHLVGNEEVLTANMVMAIRMYGIAKACDEEARAHIEQYIKNAIRVHSGDRDGAGIEFRRTIYGVCTGLDDNDTYEWDSVYITKGELVFSGKYQEHGPKELETEDLYNTLEEVVNVLHQAKQNEK